CIGITVEFMHEAWRRSILRRHFIPILVAHRLLLFRRHISWKGRSACSQSDIERQSAPDASGQARQKRSDQPCTFNETVDLDMLVERMQARAAYADRIERRDAERSGEIAVRTAAGACVGQVETQFVA